MIRLLSAFTGMFIMALSGVTATADTRANLSPGYWTLLSKQQVGLDIDRDVVKVPADGVRYTAVALAAIDQAIDLYDLKVVFGSGKVLDVRVRRTLKAGERSRAIDLPGDVRSIQRIELVYETSGKARKRAQIAVWGRAAYTGLGKGWELLGRQQAAQDIDRDVIRLPGGSGPYDGIVLRALRADAQLYDLKVTFGNGETKDITVRRMLKNGSKTDVISFAGRPRYLDNIKMIYESGNKAKRPAIIEVWGRQVSWLPGRGWRLVGKPTIEQKVDRNVIRLPKGAGRHDMMVLQAIGGDVEFYDLKLHFGNKQVQDVTIRRTLPAGKWTRAIKFDRGARKIKRVVMINENTAKKKKPPKVAVWLRRASRKAGPEWVFLGAAKADRDFDRDVIRVPRQIGLFKSVGLRAMRSPVDIYDVRVRFENGESQDVRVRKTLNPGQQTPPIDLSGGARDLSHVRLMYESAAKKRSKGVIEVWARR